jgi:hypothetical protein
VGDDGRSLNYDPPPKGESIQKFLKVPNCCRKGTSISTARAARAGPATLPAAVAGTTVQLVPSIGFFLISIKAIFSFRFFSASGAFSEGLAWSYGWLHGIHRPLHGVALAWRINLGMSHAGDTQA